MQNNPTKDAISIKDDDKRSQHTGMLLWCLIAIYAIEYIGIGLYIPGAQKVTLFLSFFVLIAVLVKNNQWKLFKLKQSKILLVFLFHTGLSITYAIVQTYAFNTFIMQLGYFILFISTYLVLTNIRKMHFFLASFIVFHLFIILENIDNLSSSGRVGRFKAGYFLGDGNDLSWSIAIFLPFAFYFLNIQRRKTLKILLMGVIGIFIVSLIAAGSRGAFLSIFCSIGYLLYTSRKKTAAIIVAVIAGAMVLAFSPQNYLDRISTIRNYQQDSSALGRIMAWKAAVRMSIDRPLGVGGGNFNSAYGRIYREKVIDERVWSGSRWISPHSIYFLVLGEYGVLGLLTILYLLFTNYKDNQKHVITQKKSQYSEGTDYRVIILPKYLNMSLIAYSAGGAFLGGINYPHIFILTAIILRTNNIILKEQELSTT